MARKAWLVTHPETQLDHQGRIHGHLDPPLSYTGKLHARQIAKGFKSKKVTKIHSSPRQRAHETAQMISKETGAPVEVHKDLEPWNLASMSGAKINSIRPLLEFFSKRPDRAVPGGESKSAVLTRYSKFMKRVKPGEAVVGHSQHSLALQHAQKGGDASKVPMVGGKAGEVKEIEV
jgi:broad specificity phosphatase PhoE